MPRASLVLSALAALAGCPSGTTTACTEIGCVTEFTVDLGVQAPPGAQLELTLTVGDQEYDCTGEVVSGQLQCTPFSLLVNDQGNLVLSGSTTEEAPVTVHALLLVDGATALDQDLALDWGEPFQPNGPDCPPTCYVVTNGAPPPP